MQGGECNGQSSAFPRRGDGRPRGLTSERAEDFVRLVDRKSTRLNSSHTVIYTLSYTTLFRSNAGRRVQRAVLGVSETRRRPPTRADVRTSRRFRPPGRSEEHTSELQSHSDLHSFLHDALPI